MLAAEMVRKSPFLDGSAPGRLSSANRMADYFKEHQSSGASSPARYWEGFTPPVSFRGTAVPRQMCGSGADGTLTMLIGKDVDLGSKRSALPPHDEIIAIIQSSLSLQIKELAGILRVQRPTIYSWIKGEVEPSAINRDRLQQVYRVALSWRKLCNLPAEQLIRSMGVDGYSVLDLLSEDKVNENVIVGRLRKLAQQRLEMQREADDKRPTAAAVARGFGLAVDDIGDQQDLIDAMTGKRSGAD